MDKIDSDSNLTESGAGLLRGGESFSDSRKPASEVNVASNIWPSKSDPHGRGAEGMSTLGRNSVEKSDIDRVLDVTRNGASVQLASGQKTHLSRDEALALGISLPD